MPYVQPLEIAKQMQDVIRENLITLWKHLSMRKQLYTLTQLVFTEKGLQPRATTTAHHDFLFQEGTDWLMHLHIVWSSVHFKILPVEKLRHSNKMAVAKAWVQTLLLYLQSEATWCLPESNSDAVTILCVCASGTSSVLASSEVTAVAWLGCRSHCRLTCRVSPALTLLSTRHRLPLRNWHMETLGSMRTVCFVTEKKFPTCLGMHSTQKLATGRSGEDPLCVKEDWHQEVATPSTSFCL